MFVSTRLLKVAKSRSLRPLSFVSTLQWGPQTSPQSACASFPTLAFQSLCTTRMSFFGVKSMVSMAQVLDFWGANLPEVSTPFLADIISILT